MRAVTSWRYLKASSSQRCFSVVTQPSLDKAFPGLPAPTPVDVTTTPVTEVSTLSNGMKVATQETYGPVVMAGVFINTGSMKETHYNNGTSHFLEHMAFKSTDKRSSLRIMRDIDAKGAVVGAHCNRDCILYTGEVLRSEMETLMEVLSETVLFPRLTPWELDDQRKVISYELESMEENAENLVTEFVHAAAYGESSPLGQPLWCPKRNLEKITDADLKSFVQSNYHPQNMVISAAGVDHKEFVALAEKYFTQTPNYTLEEQTPTPSMEYVGGSKLVSADTELTHLALVFNPGGWDSPDLFEICVLSTLLGGGGSFSAGGPGKGMYSRLYLNVLNQYGWVGSVTSLSQLYATSGLFGICGSATPQMAGNLVAAIAQELLALKSGKLSDEEINRAKAQTKSNFLMKLEERQVLFEDIGRQMLLYGKRNSPEELSAKIDAITPKSLQLCAEKILSSKPSLAAFGNVSAVPSYDAIAKLFQ